ncbi:MAG TPA: cytochrome P460 family protein [Puia sp.]|jgi:hypothetical protein
MKKHHKTSLIVLILFSGWLTVAAISFRSPGNEEVPYPEGYRAWTHVKSALDAKSHAAFHHIYGNAKAIEGYKTGNFADGSVLVFDVLEAVSKDSLVNEGTRKQIDVMVRNTDRYKSTGGWGYEEFGGDSKTERRIGVLAVTSCYNCHKQRKDNDNVFSKFRN